MIGKQLNKRGRDITTKTKKALIETLAENDRLKHEITRLRDLITEKRSDADEILTAILDGKEWSDDWVEHRYASAIINGRKVEYDTLTTLFSVEDEDGEIQDVTELEYSDD